MTHASPATPGPEKLIALDALVRRRQEYRAEGRSVVWTNGCFDLFHAGHARSLAAAKALGDVLVVGLNADVSVQALKGEGRPLVPERQRAALLSALACVDHVLLFAGKRCTPELAAVQPDVYAQGSDYTLETIDQDERAAVEGAGGRIAFLPMVDGVSTSLILKKIRRSDPERITSAAFGLIRNGAGELLLVANRYVEGVRWGLPGGGHCRGERLAETVVRECREEVGCETVVRAYRGVIERIEPRLNLHLVLHLFELDVTGGELRVDPANEDIVEARYFDAERLRAHSGWILGRAHWLNYLRAPADFPHYIFMGPGEE